MIDNRGLCKKDCTKESSTCEENFVCHKNGLCIDEKTECSNSIPCPHDMYCDGSKENGQQWQIQSIPF